MTITGFKFNTIEEAIEDLRQGKLILCTDDPDRENEGDFICAGQFATTENINFMIILTLPPETVIGLSTVMV